jgi:putative phosphoesterase
MLRVVSRLEAEEELEAAPMKLGVISDTHNFLDPKIHGLFAGVGHILHAGDIGNAIIISELEEIAPVTAVYGNTDMGLPFKETEIIVLAGRKFLIHHIVNPLAPGERVRERIAREQPRAVVFGHTHRTFCETIGGVLYFNPGSAGKPKFGLGRTAAILHCDEKEIRTEFLAL